MTTEGGGQNQQLLDNQQGFYGQESATFEVPAYQVSTKEGGEAGEFGCGTSEFGLRMDFKNRPFRDVGYLVAWVASMIIWFILLIVFSDKAKSVSDSNTSSYNYNSNSNNDYHHYYYYSNSSSNGITDSSIGTLFEKVIALFVTVIAMAILCGYLWLALMFRFAKEILKFVIGLKLLLLATATVVFFIWAMVNPGVIGAAITYLIIFLVVALYYYCVRRRLKLAAAMIRLGTKVVQTYQGTILLQFLTTIAMFVWWTLWFSVVVLYLYAYADTINGFVCFLMVLMNYWTIDVLANIAHVTTCGVTAVWWFNKEGIANPTWHSYRYATTKGLGSICFGSLLVSIVQIIKSMAKSQRSSSVAACLCYLVVSCLDWFIRYFTSYAFVQVAIYGIGFWQAGKNTFQLFSSKGIDAIINDNLSRTVLVTGALVGGILCGIVGGFMAYALFLSYTYDIAVVFAVLFAFFGLLVGYFFTMEFMLAVESAIKAVFVCWAEDPVALQQLHPICYNLLSRAWAKVLGRYAGEVEEARELD